MTLLTYAFVSVTYMMVTAGVSFSSGNIVRAIFWPVEVGKILGKSMTKID